MKKITVSLSILLFTAAFTTLKNIAADGIIRHDTEIEKYKDLGSRTEYDCVGRYAISEESTDYAVGVLIAPKWVLTASHFVHKPSVWKFGEHFYKTKRIIKHPDLKPNDEETQWDGRDMALVELDRAVPHIEPAKRYYGERGTWKYHYKNWLWLYRKWKCWTFTSKGTAETWRAKCCGCHWRNL